MATITRSIRFDENFLKLVEDYCVLLKDMLGVAPTVNSVLSDSLIVGFNNKLSMFRIILGFEENRKQYSADIIARCEDMVSRYEYFECVSEFGLKSVGGVDNE
ncbi:MAG: hypothetical protein ACRC68_01210 [Clostridium sp.]